MTPTRRQEIEAAITLLRRGIWPGPTPSQAANMFTDLLAEVDRLAPFESEVARLIPFESTIRTMASDIDPDWCINADEPIDPTEVTREYRDMWIGIAKGG